MSLFPVYYQIKNKIQEWIVSKEYNPGEKIPSEMELANIFNVSRLTVRQAISILVQEKLLYSVRGKGTFVTEDTELIDSFGLKFSGFMDDLFYQVSKSKTISVKIEKVVPSKKIIKALNLEEGDVYKIERVRLLNNLKFAFTVNYLPEKYGGKLDSKVLYNRHLLEILEVDLGVEFDEAFQTIEASFSDPVISESLEIPDGSPILYVERIMYDKDKNPVELVQSSYRGDIYKYIVNMKLDRKNKELRWIQNTTVNDIN